MNDYNDFDEWARIQDDAHHLERTELAEYRFSEMEDADEPA